MGRAWVVRAIAALIAVAALALAGCGGSESGSGGGGSAVADLAGPIQFSTPQAGGTYRMAQTDFGFTDAFDPSGEYLGTAWDIYSNLMLRTLVSYPFTAGPPGNVLVPDLATEIPAPTAGGTVYTFTLRPGVSFGPPVSRPVTSKDIAYAFERIATPSVAAQYGFYYSPIKGFDAFAAGKATTISGIETPDDTTIRFTLTQPVGDFLYRLAMPATAPVPPEVGGCHEDAGEYGRYVIASGPYMLQGSDKLDISSCASQKPISGFNPTSRLSLVRNPGYDAASGDPKIRQAFPDQFLFTINTNQKDIFTKISAGELESSFDGPPPDVLREYVRGDDATRERLRVNLGDRLWFVYMNLAEPPFDDVHVRRAMNMVTDLDGLRRAWGGPVAGEIATDVIPDAMLGGELNSEDYHPFQDPPFTGDVERAKAEMKLSKYDTDKDGLCDAAACKNVVHVTAELRPLGRDGAGPQGVGGRHRHHAQQPRAAAQRGLRRHRHRLPRHPDRLEQQLGQGLPRPLDVHGAVRQPQHRAHRQHQQLPRGHDRGPGQGPRRDDARRRDPERRRGHRPVQRADRRGARHRAGWPSTRRSPSRSSPGSPTWTPPTSTCWGRR